MMEMCEEKAESARERTKQQQGNRVCVFCLLYCRWLSSFGVAAAALTSCDSRRLPHTRLFLHTQRTAPPTARRTKSGRRARARGGDARPTKQTRPNARQGRTARPPNGGSGPSPAKLGGRGVAISPPSCGCAAWPPWLRPCPAFSPLFVWRDLYGIVYRKKGKEAASLLLVSSRSLSLLGVLAACCWLCLHS